MVYINIKDTAPAVWLPANGWEGDAESLALSVRNTVDQQTVDLPWVEVTPAGFLLRLDLSGIPEGLHPGEWQYTLTSGEETIATGLLVAYDGERPEAVQYSSDNKVIQYGE